MEFGWCGQDALTTAGGTPALLKTHHRRAVSTENDWDLHSHQDKELVKGLGLTSATMLVMGSMIGSGIFIVSAEIAAKSILPHC